MSPIRRELLNGLLVLVVASLLSVAFSALQVNFNAQLWVLILLSTAVAVSGYVIFEFVLSAEKRETEWLQRVGTPARFEMNREGAPSGADAIREAVKTMRPGGDYTVMYYFDPEQSGGVGLIKEAFASRNKTLSVLLEQLNRGIIREYKRIVCFDSNIFLNDPELRSGILRIGEGPGTIDKEMGEHCRLMMSTQGCSLFVAPAVIRESVILLGTDKVVMTVVTDEQDARGLTTRGSLLFCDPPNREIIEQFRQIERATERRMVAVHKIVFPEDALPRAEVAAH